MSKLPTDRVDRLIFDLIPTEERCERGNLAQPAHGECYRCDGTGRYIPSRINNKEEVQMTNETNYTPTTKAKEKVLKAMTILITRKGEGANGWYSKMVSAYDIKALFASKGLPVSVQQINTIVNTLIEDKMVRFYRIPNTNYISLGLTRLYFDMMDEMCDSMLQPVEEVPAAEEPAPTPKRKRGRPRKNTTVQ
jgi:hypothetical protein